MTAHSLDGKKIASTIYEEISTDIHAFQESQGRKPHLAIVVCGERPEIERYIRSKKKAADMVGIELSLFRFKNNSTTRKLEQEIRSLVARSDIDGLIVQSPLPRHVDSWPITMALDPSKDVDGFHPTNLGSLASGHMPGLLPCTPAGCMELIKRSGISISGKRAVVVGRSSLVGRPMALLLIGADATVTLCHSKTQELSEICQTADILVVAVGQPGLITSRDVKPGACVIDVGFSVGEEGTIHGDVDAQSVAEVAGWLTPVPGGVGPMTVAMLMKNVVFAASHKG